MLLKRKAEDNTFKVLKGLTNSNKLRFFVETSVIFFILITRIMSFY